MTDYVVTFFKRVLDSDGHETNAPQMAVEVGCEGSTIAAALGQREFERQRRIPNWRLHADSYRVTSANRPV